MKNPVSSPIQRRRSGFSLAEVAIAIGIAGMALVAILGLIPTSLEGVRSAGDSTAHARLAAAIAAEVQSADWGSKGSGDIPWDNLQKLIDQRWYFDDQSNPIPLNSSNFGDKLTYVARIDPDSFPLELDPSGKEQDSTFALTIQIANSTDINTTFSNPRLYTSIPVIVSRQFSSE